MKKFNILLLFFFSLFFLKTEAQDRYICPFFDDVTVTDSLIYGVNATALFFQVVGEAVPQPLYFDLYEPTGDIETDRPLVLLFHSGTFLPFPQNMLSNGNMGDSSVVYIANRLAEMGYVVAVCDYRLGWLPIAPTQDERVFGIMNAAYRAIQDARTAVRFFKKDAAENNNSFGIDPNKIVMWGIGTGGYLSMGSASLTDWLNNIALLPKFNVDDGMGNPVPVVVPAINGDIYGTSLGVAPPGYPFPAGDTLCYPNHLGYDSDFQLAVNLGGAIGDTTWVDAETIPTISFHVPTDQISPCTTALVVLGDELGSLPIVEVSGSCDFQRMQAKFNNHQDWIDAGLDDPWSMVANSRNDGLEGFFPLPTDSLENGAPWDWWADDIPDPNKPGYPWSGDQAKAYIDSIIAYVAPRACITLGLGCDLSGDWYSCLTDLTEIQIEKIDLKVSPNPAVDYVNFQAKEYPIEHIYVYDLSGRLVKVHTNINSFNFEMKRNNLDNGVYIAQVRFEQGFISKQIVFQN